MQKLALANLFKCVILEYSKLEFFTLLGVAQGAITYLLKVILANRMLSGEE